MKRGLKCTEPKRDSDLSAGSEPGYSEQVLFFSDPNSIPAGKIYARAVSGRFVVKSNYSLAKQLRPREVAVRSAEGFFNAVRVATKRGEFLVHGAKRPDAKSTAKGLMLRRKIGKDATVQEVARRGWAVDVDLKQASPLHAALCAEGVNVFADIKGAAATVARLALPDWMRMGPLLWQASGSCGLADPSYARFHYFCWLDKPLLPAAMKRLIRYHNANLQSQGLSDSPHTPCDTALYQGVQPVYLSATFEGGPDPIATRLGLLGSQKSWSRVPKIETVAKSKVDKLREVVSNGKGGFEPLPADDISWPGRIEECLSLIGDGPNQHGFHRPLLHVTWRMACDAVMEGRALTEEWVQKVSAKLGRVIDKAPGAERTAEQIAHYKAEVPRYLTEGYAKAKARQEERLALARRTGALHPEPGLPLKQAEAAMRKEIRRFISEAQAWNKTPQSKEPPRETLAASPGLGKSHTAMLEILQLVDLCENRVVVVVPTHKLAEEWAEQCERLATEQGVQVPTLKIVKGRDQPGMCEPPAHQRQVVKQTIDAAINMGVSATQSACEACERKAACPYLQQWTDSGPGLVLVPQAYFRFGVVPGISDQAADAAAPIALVVIDESITDALRRSQVVNVASLRKGLRSQSVLVTDKGLVGVVTTQDAMRLDCRALNDLDSDEELLHETTRAVGSFLKSSDDLPLSSIAEALTLERDGRTWASLASDKFKAAERALVRNVQGQMRHALKKKRFDHVDGDRRRRLRVMRWMIALLELLDHHARTPQRSRVVGLTVRSAPQRRKDKDSNVRRAELSYMGKLPEFAIKHPLLILDATADPELMKLALARTPRRKDKLITIRAEPEHAKLTMVRGAPTRMGELAPKGLKLSKRLASDHPIERLHQLVWMLDAHERRFARPGRVGLITYKRTCTYLDKQGLLIGVPKMHFGALRGLNALEDVSTLVIAGRLWPNGRELSRLTEALLAFDAEGRETEHDGYDSNLRGVRMKGGGCEAISQTEHVSEPANLVLASLVDAEVMQALGRARALRRTADNPVHVILLADRVVDATFDEVVAASEIMSSTRTAMLIGQGVVPSKGKAAWQVGPGLFSDLQQAQRWVELNGYRDHAGEQYWLTQLDKAAPNVKAVSLPGHHAQKIEHLGKARRKLRRIFGAKFTHKVGQRMVFQRVSDGGDLDAPVLADRRSPGSQVTRRVALELWAKSGSQNKFALALGKRLGRVVSRKAARTIIGELAQFAPKARGKAK